MHADLVAGEAFDAAQRHHVVTAHQGNGGASGASAASAANAVHVVFGKARQVEVEHMADASHVDATGGDVGGHQQVEFATAQLGQRAGAFALRHVAMQGGGAQAFHAQFVGQFFGVTLGGGEDNGLLDAFLSQEVLQQPFLVAQVVHIAHHLVDLLMTGGLRGNFDGGRVIEQFVGKRTHIVRGGGGEECSLTLFRQLAGNRQHVVGETHVQHAVGFVQHQHFQAGEVNTAGIDVVNQTARGGHQNFVRLGQQVVLDAVGHAAHHTHGFDARQALGKGFCCAGYLLGQLAGGGEHQHTGATALGVFSRLRQAMQRRQQEGSGFAGASLCRPDQITSLQQQRNGLFLHRGRCGQLVLGQGGNDTGVEAERLESRLRQGNFLCMDTRSMELGRAGVKLAGSKTAAACHEHRMPTVRWSITATGSTEGRRDDEPPDRIWRQGRAAIHQYLTNRS